MGNQLDQNINDVTGASTRERFTVLLPIAVCISAYFFTTVLGNIIYLFSFGRDLPMRSMPYFSWTQFHQTFGPGYWLLLLCPLVVTPPLSWFFAKFFRPIVGHAETLIPEFSRTLFIWMNTACLIYVAYSLYHADALDKLFAGKDSIDAVRYRFDLQRELGLVPRFVLMSTLQFLSVYATIKALRSKERFWITSAAINVALMSTFFVLMNMKWPLVLFEITLAAAAFVCVPKRYVLASTLVFAISIATYFAVSFALLRTPATEAARSNTTQTARPNADVISLAVVAINRMAMATPFYYDIFTTDGPACGSFFDRVVFRKPDSCHPSIFVYSKMFPDDGFNGRGTAPASHQIYEYARSGWTGAVIALVLGSIVLGFYTACYFARDRDTFATVFVMGVPAAYLLTQLPVEAVLISEAGAAWWVLLIGINAVMKLAGRQTTSMALSSPGSYEKPRS